MEPLVDEQIQQRVCTTRQRFRLYTPRVWFLTVCSIHGLRCDFVGGVRGAVWVHRARQGRRGTLIKDTHDGLVLFGIMARLYPFTYWIKSTFLGKYFVASPEQDSGIGA